MTSLTGLPHWNDQPKSPRVTMPDIHLKIAHIGRLIEAIQLGQALRFLVGQFNARSAELGDIGRHPVTGRQFDDEERDKRNQKQNRDQHQQTANDVDEHVQLPPH